MSYYQLIPSKHIPLARLKQIKKDNFTSESGQDFCPFEIEARIVEIEMKQAMEFVSKSTKLEKRKAVYDQVNDILKTPIKFIINKPKPMFPINMALEMMG